MQLELRSVYLSCGMPVYTHYFVLILTSYYFRMLFFHMFLYMSRLNNAQVASSNINKKFYAKFVMTFL